MGLKLIDASEIEESSLITSDIKKEIKKEEKQYRIIKLKQDIYYGPGNKNKSKFVRMYKNLGLIWRSDTIDGVEVEGWFNKDNSQYIIKLPEEGDFKRFKFYGCNSIYDYFKGLGALEANEKTVGVEVGGKKYQYDEEFIAPDLALMHNIAKSLKEQAKNVKVIGS